MFGRIDYFIIIDKENSGIKGIARDSILVIESKKELFEKLEKDYKNIKYNLEE